MKIKVDLDGQSYTADLDHPLSIAIPIRKSGNPNCYFTEPPRIEPVRSGDFIGSIANGALVNHKKLTIAPHGNGTHTECSGHIFDNGLTIDKALQEYHMLARLITITPRVEGQKAYISAEDMDWSEKNQGANALIIRTQPNGAEKLSKNYSGTNPPYISEAAMAKIVAKGINHLIVDLPSVDPEVDDGKLVAHKTFWAGEQRENFSTITELAYIPDNLTDGLYLLNIQVLQIQLDASPSNPILYSLSPT